MTPKAESGVDPSQPERASEQLRDNAWKLCADAARAINRSPQRDIGACIHDTVTAALGNLTAPHVSGAPTGAHDVATPARVVLEQLDPNKLSMRVSLADLDLSTRQGTRIADERLRTAARRLCGRLSDELDLGRQPHFVACVDRAMADAHRGLMMLQLSAQNTQSGGH
jgi:UrcA family protein